MNNTEPEQFETAFEKYLTGGPNQTTVQALPIILFNEYVEVEISKDTKKRIGYDNFKKLLDKMLDEIKTDLEIKGLLPPSNMFFMSQSATNMFINCYYSGGNKDMIYGTTKMNVVTPNIIISYKLRRENEDWLVCDTRYLCTDLPISKLPKTWIDNLNKAKGIYLLPMSNTYGDARMCFGGNSMPVRFKDGNLRGLDWYFKYLWETPFNSDLGIKAISDSKSVTDWYKHLEKLAKDNKPFPYEELTGYVKIA